MVCIYEWAGRYVRRVGWARTVEPLRLLVVAHLVMAEGEVVEAFPPPCRFSAVDLCTCAERQFRFRVGANDREAKPWVLERGKRRMQN